MIEATLISLNIQMLIGQDMQMIDVLHRGIVFLLVETWSHGRAKSKQMLLDQVQAKYQAMAHATCELLWLKHLLQELHFCEVGPMELVCDNHSALHLSSNSVFHERTKHIEVDSRFLREKITTGTNKTSFVNFKDQLVDLFTTSDYLHMWKDGCLWCICTTLKGVLRYDIVFIFLFFLISIIFRD